MAIQQNYIVKFSDIKQMYQNLNAKFAESGLYGRTDFGFPDVGIPDLENKLLLGNTPVDVLNTFVKELGTNSFIKAQGAGKGVTTVTEKDTLVKPYFLNELSSQIDVINKICPFDGDAFSKGAAFTNSSNFSGYNPNGAAFINSTNFSGFPSDTTNFSGFPSNTTNFTGFPSNTTNFTGFPSNTTDFTYVPNTSDFTGYTPNTSNVSGYSPNGSSFGQSTAFWNSSNFSGFTFHGTSFGQSTAFWNSSNFSGFTFHGTDFVCVDGWEAFSLSYRKQN